MLRYAVVHLHPLIQLLSTFGSTKAVVLWLGGKRVWALVITRRFNPGVPAVDDVKVGASTKRCTRGFGRRVYAAR
jgi:hypothetical protein